MCAPCRPRAPSYMRRVTRHPEDYGHLRDRLSFRRCHERAPQAVLHQIDGRKVALETMFRQASNKYCKLFATLAHRW